MVNKKSRELLKRILLFIIWILPVQGMKENDLWHKDSFWKELSQFAQESPQETMRKEQAEQEKQRLFEEEQKRKNIEREKERVERERMQREDERKQNQRDNATIEFEKKYGEGTLGFYIAGRDIAGPAYGIDIWIVNKKIDLPELVEHLKRLKKIVGWISLKLTLNGCEISDIKPLASFGEIEALSLDNNNIQNISYLSDLKSLYRLSLYNNKIENIEPLASLQQLKDLTLSYNNIQNLNPLSSLVNIEFLYLNNNKISDLTALKNLKNLKWLFLAENQIVNIQPLQFLATLTELSLSNNKIKDASPLLNLKNIRKLDILHNDINYENYIQHSKEDFVINSPENNPKELLQEAHWKSPKDFIIESYKQQIINQESLKQNREKLKQMMILQHKANNNQPLTKEERRALEVFDSKYNIVIKGKSMTLDEITKDAAQKKAAFLTPISKEEGPLEELIYSQGEESVIEEASDLPIQLTTQQLKGMIKLVKPHSPNAPTESKREQKLSALPKQENDGKIESIPAEGQQNQKKTSVFARISSNISQLYNNYKRWIWGGAATGVGLLGYYFWKNKGTPKAQVVE